MRFFVLETAEGPWGFLQESPRNINGVFLDCSKLTSDSFQMAVRLKAPITDVVRCAGGIYLFSTRAKETLEQLRSPDDAGWVKVAINLSSGEEATYFALVGEKSFDVIDRARSDFEWLIPDQYIGKVNKWVLQKTTLPDFDFFMASNGRWIFAGEVVDLIEQKAFTGFDFPTECEVV